MEKTEIVDQEKVKRGRDIKTVKPHQSSTTAACG